jgi:hypothetical protein
MRAGALAVVAVPRLRCIQARAWSHLETPGAFRLIATLPLNAGSTRWRCKLW